MKNTDWFPMYNNSSKQIRVINMSEIKRLEINYETDEELFENFWERLAKQRNLYMVQ